jgi:hypothetical protein
MADCAELVDDFQPPTNGCLLGQLWLLWLLLAEVVVVVLQPANVVAASAAVAADCAAECTRCSFGDWSISLV